MDVVSCAAFCGIAGHVTGAVAIVALLPQLQPLGRPVCVDQRVAGGFEKLLQVTLISLTGFFCSVAATVVIETSCRQSI